MLAGHPAEPRWHEVVAEANRAMSAAYAACHFSPNQKKHRRGDFATLAQGFSYGGGQKTPGRIAHTSRHEKVLVGLCSNPAIRRIAGFGNSMLATYAPRIYHDMGGKLKALLDRHPSLWPPFPNSMYPATSFNFGPATICREHTDSQNDPCNWCHIAALGDYDPNCGGHLRRMSLTQYCAGGLLRWVECGFRTVEELAAQDSEGHEAFREALKHRVEERVQLFSDVHGLANDMRAHM
ncbi:hypothetical protein FKP32DRAFT_1609019 [Trametes sanguinea]|nr:hypothetical protein FKP32DRAFT_1609019 [Trametes sanguinea]